MIKIFDTLFSISNEFNYWFSCLQLRSKLRSHFSIQTKSVERNDKNRSNHQLVYFSPYKFHFHRNTPSINSIFTILFGQVNACGLFSHLFNSRTQKLVRKKNLKTLYRQGLYISSSPNTIWDIFVECFCVCSRCMKCYQFNFNN